MLIHVRDECGFKQRSNGKGRTQKIATQNHQQKTTTIFRHINRADGLEKQTLSGKIDGTTSRARQRTGSLNNFLTRKESSKNEFMERTDDREDWKAMIADVCNIPGT